MENVDQSRCRVACLMRAALALLAILTGPVVAVTHRPLSGWTILACVLLVAGFALLVELTHHVVEVVEP